VRGNGGEWGDTTRFAKVISIHYDNVPEQKRVGRLSRWIAAYSINQPILHILTISIGEVWISGLYSLAWLGLGWHCTICCADNGWEHYSSLEKGAPECIRPISCGTVALRETNRHRGSEVNQMTSQFDLTGFLLHLLTDKCLLDISDPCRENERNSRLITKRDRKSDVASLCNQECGWWRTDRFFVVLACCPQTRMIAWKWMWGWYWLVVEYAMWWWWGSSTWYPRCQRASTSKSSFFYLPSQQHSSNLSLTVCEHG